MNWEKHGIDISKVRGGKTLCPRCSHTRKHKNDPCLSVNKDSGLFNCHNPGCDFKGTAKEFVKKEWTKPEPRPTKPKSQTVDWFSKRGISEETLTLLQVTEAKEWMPQANKEMNCICFNYYRDGELVNIKFRDGAKGFKLQSGAELILYNLDAIRGQKEVVIVEGEIDCLTLQECGISNVVSVPNGASKGSQRLEYLDNCWKELESADRVILAVDDDEAGQGLKNELGRRIGRDRCLSVTYPSGCKDFNEVLVKHGKDSVKDVYSGAKHLPIEGVIEVEDVIDQIGDWYENGYPKGASTNIPGFDNLLKFSSKGLTIITGIPGHGKDEFFNAIAIGLAKNEGWKFGMCGYEETPAETITKLAEKYSDRAFDFRKDPTHRINTHQLVDALEFIQENFKFINTDEIEPTLEEILSVAAQMVRRYGIKGFCLNPWNWIENQRPKHITETEWVSVQLTKIVLFSKKYDVHFFLMAHPTKLGVDKQGKPNIPNLYSISGSANFYNKTYNGISVYRDDVRKLVDVYILKVKQSWYGEKGFCTFSYDTFTRKYHAV